LSFLASLRLVLGKIVITMARQEIIREGKNDKEMAQSGWALFKRFTAYYKPHKTMFFLDMVASFLISAIALVYPIITQQMVKTYIPDQNFTMIWILAAVLLALYVLRMFLKYFVQFYGHMMGTYMQAQMRTDMFSHLEKLPYSYYDNHETGKIMSRMTTDLQDVSELAHHGPENFFISGFMIVATFVYLMTLNVYLTLIIFSVVPLVFLITANLRKGMAKAFMESRRSVAMINASLENSLTGIRTTKAFTNSQKEAEKFEQSNQGFVKAKRLAYKAMAKFQSSTAFITDLFNVVVLVAGAIFLANGTFGYDVFAAFIVSINMFINPLTTLINFTEQFEDGVTGFKRFAFIMDEPAEQDEKDAVNLTDVKGKIELKDVSFYYKNDREILKHVSLEIGAGEKLALVGPSGGGKTTICHLIPRFYKTQEGEISIDGHDINKITMESLRQNIGIVQQDVFIFDGTIAENILYGKLGASEEEIIQAAKKARLFDYVMSLPDKFLTQVGERGVKLSGGQKQRISIARIFLKDPSILILDEATSALDNTTELLIQEALDDLCKGRTTIVVAHRLSTIKTADRIAVVDQGEIKEIGTHEELMALKGGIYRQLYELQFRPTSKITGLSGLN
jgi:ATP-binding cassette subfamily B protein